MRRCVQRREEDVPTLAIAARSAGKRRREHEVERRNLPLVFGEIAFPLQAVRLQEVGGRIVVAMLLLDTGEERELAFRAQVDFEPGHAVDDVIVHALAVAAIRFATGLPVAVEDAFRIPRVRGELRWRSQERD